MPWETRVRPSCVMGTQFAGSGNPSDGGLTKRPLFPCIKGDQSWAAHALQMSSSLQAVALPGWGAQCAYTTLAGPLRAGAHASESI